MTKRIRLPDERLLPKRWLGKEEAIRHLIHSAIRLIMRMEDPFAIHLLVHSADKLLIDIAKETNRYLEMDWEIYIKDEYHDEFFARHRETYNYFKHAREDFDKQLPVRDIMMSNVMGLFICTVNFFKLSRVYTNHMALFVLFVQALMPNVVKLPPDKEFLYSEVIKGIGPMSPSLYFKMIADNEVQFYPKLSDERSVDLQDIAPFYSTPFAELRLKRASRSKQSPEA
jgi:hypothetical protein